jgi:predicted amidohydrolase
MRKVKITLAQIGEQESLSEIRKIIRKRNDSDLIVFPDSVMKTVSLELIGDIQRTVTENSTAAIIGIIHQKGKRSYNYAYYISPEKVERYQKIHVHWTESFVPGREFKVVETPFGKVGLLICYDSSFQESGRILSLMGAEMVVIISAIPSSFPYRISLLRAQAMALNNQVFVVDSCRPGKEFTGHGAIFDPRGRELNEMGKFRSIITRTIDMDLVGKWREEERIFPQRKPGLYKMITSRRGPD